VPEVRVLKSEADMPEQLADGVGTSVDLIDKDPDLVTRMVRALGQANAEARARPDWAGALLEKRMEMPGAGKQLASVLIQAFPVRLTPTPALYAAEANFMSRSSTTPVTPETVAAAWDTRFSTAIDREMTSAPAR
jgi:ABC-type nitrate/sulfonate/bicarbonate transport system substrate-binding protein